MGAVEYVVEDSRALIELHSIRFAVFVSTVIEGSTPAFIGSVTEDSCPVKRDNGVEC